MTPEIPQGRLLHFATSDQPNSQRVPFWLEAFARKLVHLEIELKSDELRAEADMMALPDLRIMWCKNETPVAWRRTSDLLSDGDDDIAFLMSVDGDAVRTHLGKNLEMHTGDGVGIIQNETASLELRRLNHVAVMVPRSSLAPFVPDIEATILRVISRETPALRLLQAYLAGLRKENGITDHGLKRVVAKNIRDLLAAAVGTTGDGLELAKPGSRAARVHIMKAVISENPGIRLHELAKRQGITSRSVQMLFEEAGTTFTSFALEQRLQRAYEILVDSSHDHWTIGAIAFHVGFGDLSYFNRRFKRRFGATPSDVRVDGRSR
jgi:AraC-like DNA-binding protein